MLDNNNTLDPVNMSLSTGQVEILRDAVAELISRVDDDIRSARKHRQENILNHLKELHKEYNDLYVTILKIRSRHNKEQVAKGKTPVFG